MRSAGTVALASKKNAAGRWRAEETGAVTKNHGHGRRRFSMHATLQILEFQDGSIPVMRVFDIQLDSKLRLNPHIDLTAAKAASHMALITPLTKSTWDQPLRRSMLLLSVQCCRTDAPLEMSKAVETD
jgi:hypothetical protein